MAEDLQHIDRKDIDKEDMYGILENFPNQVKEALDLGKDIKIVDKVEKIIVTGMGGSCLPGEILVSYLKDFTIPVFLVKGYELPAFTDSKTLVFTISYSGNTEEPVNAFRNALRKGAQIVTIASGGKLLELAKSHSINHIVVPSGIQPRLAYGYLFMAVLNVLINSNLVEDKTKDIKKMIEALKKPIYKERAEEIAQKVSRGPTMAFGSTRRLLTNSFSNDLESHLDEEIENLKKNAAADDFKEGIKSFFEKRKPNFKGK
jgi:bifunctional phosphoglucose/phosphomannose isomerase